MGTLQTITAVVGKAMTILATLAFIVSIYYWLLFWTTETGPYNMSRAFTWLTIAGVLLLVGLAILRRGESYA